MTSHAKQVYPEDWSCIVDSLAGKGGIFIGNLQAAQNINTLKKLQVQAVLTAAKGIDLGHSRSIIPYFLHVPADDHESFDISRYFHQAAAFIHQCLQKTNIMVHCLAGVSRSVSLVLAYLIKHKGATYNEAYNLVKSRRRIIHPNDGFINQLKKFERQLPPVIREETKSLSPQKQYQRELYQTNSPSKMNGINIDSILSKYSSYTRKLDLPFQKNPEYLQKKQAYSPPKTTKRVRRYISSDYDYLGSTQSQQLTRSKVQASYTPFCNLQNRAESRRDYSDIDRRIEQIRKKYQDYCPSSKYNNYLGQQNDYRSRVKSGYYEGNKQQVQYNFQRRRPVGQYQIPNVKRLTSLQQY